MDKFDEKVIGYESTKEILRQILDILKRPETYKRKGISIPRGLLMESDPGLGKSLLASILMEESERKPFVFRKTSQENSFLDELRTVFAMAKEEAPSILLLEDADAGEQRRPSTNRDFIVMLGHCIKGHKAFLLLDFNDKSSEFLFVEIH